MTLSGIKKNNFKISATEFGVQIFKTRFVIEICEISGLTGFMLSKKSMRGVRKVPMNAERIR
jgi:hypothetical protein